MPSAIEWTGETWNPVTGCTKVSPACANCYIERQTPMRVAGRRFVKGHLPIEFHESRLDAPLRWRAPRMVFVNSMSDLFHEDVPEDFIDRVFAVMALAPQHTFQILTKRAERMHEYFARQGDGGGDEWDRSWNVAGALRERGVDESFVGNLLRRDRWPLPNVWLGVSVENQHFADARIPLLLQTPAAVRFLSCEPLLGALDLRPFLHGIHEGPIRGVGPFAPAAGSLGWVIAGGESGPKVRPSDPAWFRSLRDQCVAAGVQFFFKQWGGRTSKSGGRELDGRTWDQFPEARA